MKSKRILRSLLLILAFLLATPVVALAADWPSKATDYDFDAKLMEGCPGVYTVRPFATGSNIKPTIGFPSIADVNLENKPTTESPAIIMGAAVPYETRKSGPVNPNMFELIDPAKPVVAPYSYFRPQVVEEQNTTASTDPTKTHYKMSGFDGTYVILRIDVTKLIAGIDENELANYYLHVKQSGNKAMLVAIGEQTNLTFDGDGNEQAGQTMSYGTFASPQAATEGAAALGCKVGSYSLANHAAALKSTDGADTTTPYIDVVLLASGGLVAGGDVSAADQGDVEISFYVDDQKSYPETIPDTILTGGKTTAMSYTKASEQAKAQAAGSSSTTTSPTLEDLYLKKYFSANPTNPKNSATYTLKGSDLALETMMAGDTSRQSDKATEYWSLAKALTHTYYDGVTSDKTGAIIKLMSEVPVVKGLSLTGASKEDPKKRTLDVNTFDIQIADNSSGSSSTAGLTLKNAWLELMDSNDTTGSELAVGNNASMVVDDGGKLIIDEDGQLEVEYDAASQAQPASGQTQPSGQQSQPINNGVLTIKEGGEIENNGVITIEGTEAKAIDPTVNASTQAPGKGAIINRGTITNNGCLSTNGDFFNVGTLINNGKYTDVIESNDPDKGKFVYHKGIQLSWKDDVTQQGSQTTGGTTINIYPGTLVNGYDSENEKFVPEASLINNGDIVMAPGMMYNIANFKNAKDSAVYLGVAVKAVVPIIDPNDPTKVTKEKVLTEPMTSVFANAYGWDGSKTKYAVLENEGTITTALVDVPNNGVLGTISAPAYLDVSSYDRDGGTTRSVVEFDNYGTFYMGESGKLVLPLDRNRNPESVGTLLNCDSAVEDTAAHKGQIMTKSTTEGGEATLTKDVDVTLPYTTFTATGAPAITLNPASGIKANDKVELTGTLKAWSDHLLAKETATEIGVSGTDFSKTISCSEMTKPENEHIYTFSYADNDLTLPAAGTYHAWYKILGNADYTDAEPASLEFTVSSGSSGGDDSETADAVQEVIEKINALTEPYDEAKVKEARDAYEKLTDEQKADQRLTAEIMKKLTDAEEAVKAAEEEKADQEAATKVTDLIAALPDDPAQAGEGQIDEAVAAYKALSEKAKALVASTDVEKLQTLVNAQAGAQKTVLKTVKPKKGKKAIAKWTSNSAASGYQLYFKAKGVKAKKVNIKKASALKKVVKKLKPGKKYTFKVRTFTKVENLANPGTFTKVYGKWSNKKKIKARK